MVGASGLPLPLTLSPGQAHDSTAFESLLDEQFPAVSFSFGDNAYDAEWTKTLSSGRSVDHCRT